MLLVPGLLIPLLYSHHQSEGFITHIGDPANILWVPCPPLLQWKVLRCHRSHSLRYPFPRLSSSITELSLPLWYHHPLSPHLPSSLVWFSLSDLTSLLLCTTVSYSSFPPHPAWIPWSSPIAPLQILLIHLTFAPYSELTSGPLQRNNHLESLNVTLFGKRDLCRCN